MSLVSTVSQQLMDRFEVERNPISLAAVKALGDAHLKCCIQMYHSLALITKGSVRIVEESNGAEAWRLIHSRYLPDTQNGQHVLMQKIMMLATLWCVHAERFSVRFQSLRAGCRRMGTCVRNCFGRCSQIQSDDEYGTEFSKEQLAVEYKRLPLFGKFCCNGGTLSEILRSKPDRVSLKWNRCEK